MCDVDLADAGLISGDAGLTFGDADPTFGDADLTFGDAALTFDDAGLTSGDADLTFGNAGLTSERGGQSSRGTTLPDATYLTALPTDVFALPTLPSPLGTVLAVFETTWDTKGISATPQKHYKSPWLWARGKTMPQPIGGS